MKYIIRDREANLDDPLGGKARALAELRRAGLPIPPWFVLTPAAFFASLSPPQRQAWDSASDPATFGQLIRQVTLAPDVLWQLRDALAELCPAGERVAVRSSASDEDGSEHSFAGQLDSFLFVAPQDVPEKVTDVWLSGCGERIVAYRLEHGLGAKTRLPSVLIQRMVCADVAGVAFGADPVSGRRSVAVVSAVPGLGSALVSGDTDADTWKVAQDGTILEADIASKSIAHAPAPGTAEGIVTVPVPAERASRPALDDSQVRAVAELVRKTGRHFSRPQDIEWAIEAGRLYLLQSRPITSLAGIADPDGVLNIWDNSNIAESYNGITTPLTFSFARKAYEEVYRQFCKLLRVPMVLMEQNESIFPRMLGLIRGRVYYNLLNWYRLLSMLPGYQANRPFMEQMMGVKEKLPPGALPEQEPATWWQRLWDRLRFVGSMLALVRKHFTMNAQVRAFYLRLKTALDGGVAGGKRRPDLSGLRADQLAAYYRDLERQLLTRWDAPLVNDFLAMIFYGVLGKLTRKWCGDSAGTLQNDLLCGEGGMISAEPAQRVRALAREAVKSEPLVQALCEGSLETIESLLQDNPAFAEQYREYLDRFGDRCMEELKLESPTLFDDPMTLLRSVGHLARRLQDSGDLPAGVETEVRKAAEQRVRQALRGRPLRRLVFARVLKHARARVRDRENLRFERTRLFGRVRLILLELGKRFFADGLLEHPRDVFFLEVSEVLGFVEGTVTCTNLKGLVSLRRAEFARYRQMPAPGDRFETRGAVYQGNDFQARGVVAVEEQQSEIRKGLGCCPGVVRGPVRVIVDPRGAILKRGEILVAERTDPGWIMLFPSAAGLLVERGSLLSHSAIVAREMGIPAIVSLTGVTRWLHDGDWVELDGGQGIVRKTVPNESA